VSLELKLFILSQAKCQVIRDEAACKGQGCDKQVGGAVTG